MLDSVLWLLIIGSFEYRRVLPNWIYLEFLLVDLLFRLFLKEASDAFPCRTRSVEVLLLIVHCALLVSPSMLSSTVEQSGFCFTDVRWTTGRAWELVDNVRVAKERCFVLVRVKKEDSLFVWNWILKTIFLSFLEVWRCVRWTIASASYPKNGRNM